MADKSPMQSLKPTVWIGKRGCTPEAVLEIRRQLEDRMVVKVRFLRGAEMDPERLARHSGGEILGVRGRMVVLGRRRGPSRAREIHFPHPRGLRSRPGTGNI